MPRKTTSKEIQDLRKALANSRASLKQAKSHRAQVRRELRACKLPASRWEFQVLLSMLKTADISIDANEKRIERWGSMLASQKVIEQAAELNAQAAELNAGAAADYAKAAVMMTENNKILSRAIAKTEARLESVPEIVPLVLIPGLKDGGVIVRWREVKKPDPIIPLTLISGGKGPINYWAPPLMPAISLVKRLEERGVTFAILEDGFTVEWGGGDWADRCAIRDGEREAIERRGVLMAKHVLRRSKILASKT